MEYHSLLLKSLLLSALFLPCLICYLRVLICLLKALVSLSLMRTCLMDVTISHAQFCWVVPTTYCAQFDDVLTSIDHDSDGCPGCTPDEDWQENGNAITWTRWVEIVVIYLTDEQDFRQEQGTHLLEGLYICFSATASQSSHNGQ